MRNNLLNNFINNFQWWWTYFLNLQKTKCCNWLLTRATLRLNDLKAWLNICIKPLFSPSSTSSWKAADLYHQLFLSGCPHLHLRAITAPFLNVTASVCNHLPKSTNHTNMLKLYIGRRPMGVPKDFHFTRMGVFLRNANGQKADSKTIRLHDHVVTNKNWSLKSLEKLG